MKSILDIALQKTYICIHEKITGRIYIVNPVSWM